MELQIIFFFFLTFYLRPLTLSHPQQQQEKNELKRLKKRVAVKYGGKKKERGSGRSDFEFSIEVQISAKPAK